MKYSVYHWKTYTVGGEPGMRQAVYGTLQVLYSRDQVVQVNGFTFAITEYDLDIYLLCMTV